jgi:transcriptional regulator with XRE-family HTH domain
MQGPGEGLRQAREAHGKTLEEMSEATGIRLPFLTALEQDAFDSLPGRGFGKLYIRAYAEVLGFDPRPVIEAYDHAVGTTDAAAADTEPVPAPRPVNAVLERWRRDLIARRAEADPSGEPEELNFDELDAEDREPDEQELIEAPAPTVPRSADPVPVKNPALSRPARWQGWWPAASVLLLVLLPSLAYLVVSRSRPHRPDDPERHEPAPGSPVAPPPSPSPSPRAVEVPRSPLPTPSPGRAKATPSSLEVTESGVGLRLIGTRLEGEGGRFQPGQRVTFATRVVGGEAGGHIQHVWLRDGKVEQSIRLRLGGASWRTWSTKTLGRPGDWAVEARDEQGRVLARADLTVAP